MGRYQSAIELTLDLIMLLSNMTITIVVMKKRKGESVIRMGEINLPLTWQMVRRMIDMWR